jgi:hypothetical protein
MLPRKCIEISVSLMEHIVLHHGILILDNGMWEAYFLLLILSRVLRNVSEMMCKYSSPSPPSSPSLPVGRKRGGAY